MQRFSAPEGIIDKERGVQPFYLKVIHDFYSDYHHNWKPETARLLEFGGGPCIYPLISAAPHVSEIVFAEYAEEGRKEVELWKNNDPAAHDWTPYFRYVDMYRLYTEVQVSTLLTQPRTEGPRLCKLLRDRTEVYNGLVPWATWP